MKLKHVFISFFTILSICLYTPVTVAADEVNHQLIRAAQTRQSLATINALINEGACVNYRDASGKTPLHWAVIMGHTEIAMELIYRKADIYAVHGDKKYTAMHDAVLRGNLEMVELLCSHHFNLDTRDRSGQTPLHLAAANSHKKIMFELLKRGADVNVTDWEKHTPLHLAARHGRTKIVLDLLQKGAGFQATTRYNQTPFDLARAHDHLETAHELFFYEATELRLFA